MNRLNRFTKTVRSHVRNYFEMNCSDEPIRENESVHDVRGRGLQDATNSDSVGVYVTRSIITQCFTMSSFNLNS